MGQLRHFIKIWLALYCIPAEAHSGSPFVNTSQQKSPIYPSKTLKNTSQKMQDKKPETTVAKTTNPKKANLLDHNSIKHLLDETVSEVSFSFLLLSDLPILYGFCSFFFPSNSDSVLIFLFIFFSLFLCR